MKLLLAISVACSTLQFCAAHYTFPYFLYNETFSTKFQYTRRVADPLNRIGTAGYPYMRNLSSPDIRCGVNATNTGPETGVALVEAGSKVGFRVDFRVKSTGIWGLVFHDGPLASYLSRSPEQTEEGLKNWDGDGDYFKIAQRGPVNNQSWYTNETLQGITFSEFNFTIPERTPPGFYLMRMDSIYPTGSNMTQFYAGCAQVQIVGPGGGSSPQQTTRFPVSPEKFDVFRANGFGKNLPTYKIPGPDVWTG